VRTIAILPIKSFTKAKQRLAPGVAGETRAQLAEAMATDVAEALGRVSGLDRLVVVTGDERAQALANAAGAQVVDDPAEAGQSAATLLGIDAVAGACDRVLLIAGDCPALDPVEVDALLARPAGAAAEAVIVPDRHRTGTNALLLSPPDVIAPAFGPGSRARHLELAADAGAACSEAELASLAIDVDEADDLEALREALTAWLDRAPRTRAVLDRIAPAPPE
jgi:2-phospho-L-lactate/phosphoenolpyruvate guanylyltransferase